MDKLTLPKVNSQTESVVLLAVAITICLLLNVMYFISVAASPIIRDDGWYFLASQIQPWVEHGFSWADIFVKRGLTDHAQPLNKIFLFLNYKLFSLDFKYEGIIGFFGILCIVFLFLSIFIKNTLNQSMTLTDAGFFILAILTLTSLNSRELYSWPLVTFSYLSLFLALLLPVFAWRFLNYQSTILPILIAIFIFVLIGDTASIIAWLSLTIAIVLISVSDRELSKKRAIVWIGCSAFVVVAYFIVLNINFMGGGTQPKSNNNLDLLNVGFYLELVRIVFSSSLIHPEHLARTGSYQWVLSWAIAIPVLFFYMEHFFSIMFKRQRQTLVDLLVTFMLVYATLSVAAIVVGRVAEFGISYLNQPRYVLIYQLIPFALFIKYCFLPVLGRRKIVGRRLMVTVVLPLMLCAQFHFTANAYNAIPWMSKWIYNQSKAIAHYVNNPSLPAGNCTNFSSPVCNLSESKRNELLDLMITNKLNIFNHEFQWKYRIFPPVELKASSVSGWGPQIINVRSADGVWVKLSAPIISSEVKLQVKINEKSVEQVVFTGDVITFYLPDEYKSVPGHYKIEYSIDDWASSVLVGAIQVIN